MRKATDNYGRVISATDYNILKDLCRACSENHLPQYQVGQFCMEDFCPGLINELWALKCQQKRIALVGRKYKIFGNPIGKSHFLGNGTILSVISFNGSYAYCRVRMNGKKTIHNLDIWVDVRDDSPDRITAEWREEKHG